MYACRPCQQPPTRTAAWVRSSNKLLTYPCHAATPLRVCVVVAMTHAQLEGALAFSERKVKDQLATIDKLQVGRAGGVEGLGASRGRKLCS